MSKAIFFNVPATGHVNPSLPVVAELVRRGERVIYYLTENYRTKVEATGAEFRPYALLDDTYLERNRLVGTNPPLAAAKLMEVCAAMLPDLLAVARAEQPDYIIYDSMCPWGVLVARILNLPSVSSAALLIFDTSMMLRSAGLQTLLPMMIRGAGHIRRFRQLSAAVSREYGVSPLSFSEFFNAPGELIVSYTTATIQPNADRLEGNVVFVGPSIAPRGDAGDFPLDQLEGQSVIYISLGTLANDNPGFFRACLRAFADTPYTVVMSTGDRIALDSLGPIPPNAIVRPYNPQLEILQRSTLFITHAGMNSVHEGLYYDLPLLLVPQQQEQTFVALRIQELGAGLRLKEPTADAIRHAAYQLLADPRYRRLAAQLGADLRAAGGAARAADHILALLRNR